MATFGDSLDFPYLAAVLDGSVVVINIFKKFYLEMY
jgi:hypothetical protein